MKDHEFMPNIASVRKSEISRLARKEVKAELEMTRSTNARQRAEIAALRRRIQELERTVAHMANGNARSTASPLADEATSVKCFSAKGLASQRRLLGLSAEDFGKLVGASALSIYKCESGKAKPQSRFMAAIGAIRGIGKKEAARRLAAE